MQSFIIKCTVTGIYMSSTGFFDTRSEFLAQKFEDTETRRNYVARNYPEPTYTIINVNN